MLDVYVGYVLIFIGILGSGIAGYFDLKTTEIPDEISLIMIVLGLAIRGAYSLISGDWMFLIIPALISIGFFGFGLAMYYLGQWGGGDAKILAAMGLLLGVLPGSIVQSSIFPLFFDYFFNVFFVGAAYIIVYAFIIAAMNPKIMREFYKSIKDEITETVIFSVILAASIGIVVYLFWSRVGIFNITLPLGLLSGGIGLFILWKFLKTIEDVGFRKKIKTKYLKEGDMIGEDIPKLNLKSKIIRGLTKEEVIKIKKIKKNIWIREGVRFGPVFCIAAIVTLLYGNLIMFIL